MPEFALPTMPVYRNGILGADVDSSGSKVIDLRCLHFEKKQTSLEEIPERAEPTCKG